MDKVQAIEFFIKEFKSIQVETQIKHAISNEFDEQFQNSKNMEELFMLLEKMDIAKEKFDKEMLYLQGKCDGYVKVMEMLGIDCSQFKNL